MPKLLVALTFFVLLIPSLALASPLPTPTTRRNPFRPLPTPTTTPLDKQRPPLEQYPLSTLSLTAIITNMEGELFASMEIPSGVGFKVKPGTILGESGARVTEVLKNGIVVEERSNGELVRKEIPLRKKAS